MAEIVDDRTIINDALALIGSSPIFALDEDTSLARQAIAVYYPRRDALLGLWAWQFARRTYQLTQVAKTAENGYSATNYWGNGYRYAYAKPGNVLGEARKILTNPKMPDRPLRQFLLEEGRIYADFTPLWAAFTVQADPQIWSPSFRLAAQTLIAADLCIPVTHDKDLAEALREKGEGPIEAQGLGGLVGRAIAADVSGSPGPAPLQMDDDLTTAHMT